MVRDLDKSDDVDRSYYDKLVDDAVKTISQYGDFEWFVSDDPYIPSLGANDSDIDVLPWELPCGNENFSSCYECPHFSDANYHMDCELNYDISDLIMRNAMNPPVK
jgi:hypothetical protein